MNSYLTELYLHLGIATFISLGLVIWCVFGLGARDKQARARLSERLGIPVTSFMSGYWTAKTSDFGVKMKIKTASLFFYGLEILKIGLCFVPGFAYYWFVN